MGGAPGLYAALRNGEGSGNLIQFLGNKDKLQGLAVASLYAGISLLDVGFHIGLESLAHNVHHFAKTGLYGIVDAIVDDGFSVGAQAVHLFEAAVTAAHSSCKNK